MNIVIETYGTETLISRFRGIEDRASNLRPVFSEIADDFNLVAERAFGGTPDLVRTGAVRDALTKPDVEGSVRTFDLDQMVAGTDIWYARFHRDRLEEPVSPTVERRWLDMIQDFIIGGPATSRIGL